MRLYTDKLHHETTYYILTLVQISHRNDYQSVQRSSNLSTMHTVTGQHGGIEQPIDEK